MRWTGVLRWMNRKSRLSIPVKTKQLQRCFDAGPRRFPALTILRGEALYSHSGRKRQKRRTSNAERSGYGTIVTDAFFGLLTLYPELDCKIRLAVFFLFFFCGAVRAE